MNKQLVTSLKTKLNRLWDETERIEGLAKIVQESIENEEFLTGEMFRELQDAFIVLDGLYAECKESYEKLTGKEFCFETIGAFEKAVYEETEKMLFSETIDKANMFLRLTSSDQTINESLTKHKERLQRLMSYLPKNIKPLIQPYIDFVNASDEPEPGKKMELSLTLVLEFGAALVGCLMTGAIRLENQNTATATTP